MLTRSCSASGVVLYQSPLLAGAGAPHAFSTRIGGVSPPPFDTLNLGNPGGCDILDSSDHLAENYRRLLSAIGCENRTLARVHQVHGNACVVLDRGGASVDPSTQADALVCNADPTRIVSVRIADCVPILLASRDGRCVAAVHAGWRGVIANVVGAAVNHMIRITGSPGQLVAAIGPSIGADAFEVGDEVADAFRRAFDDDAKTLIRRGPSGRPHVDLRQAIRRQLLACRIEDDCIDTTDRCTFGGADEFFSHRRDRGRTGRMAAMIGCHS